MAKNRVISAVLTLKDKDFTANAKKSASATKDFERKVKYAGNTVSQFGRSAASSFKSVATGATSIAAAIGITRGLSSAFNMVKSSISSAFDRIDTMETFQSTMTVLTGSADKAQQALEKTRESVTGTAFGLDVAAKGVQSFVTRGMKVEKATSTIAAWGDAVAFYGDGSNEQLASVTDALGKMYSSGKVGMDQMNRLYDAGIDGVGMYAKAVGRDAGAVQKDLSKGKISAESFIDVVSKAMMEGTNGVQKIAGSAKNAGASWSGSFANMRAAVNRGTTEIIQSIDKMLTDNGFPDMRSMVVSFGSGFENTLKNAAGVVPLLSGSVVGMYKAVRPGLDWLKGTAFPAVKGELVDMYVAAQPGLNWMKDVAFPGVVNAIGLAVDSATTMYNFFKNNWSAIEPVVVGVTVAIATYKVGIIATTAVTRTWNVVTAAATLATNGLNVAMRANPIGAVATAIGILVMAGVALYQNWDTVSAKATEVWGAIGGISGAISLVLGPVGFLINAGMDLAKNWDNTKTVWENVWDSIKRSAATSVNAVVGSINSMIDVINKIPGVNIPIVPKVDWGQADISRNSAAGLHALESYDVGTNRVPRDMVAQIHKDEMIIPATQSRNLRKQGVTIDNIDQPRPQQSRSMQVSNNASASTQGYGELLAMIAELIQLIKNMPKGDVNVQIDGHNKSITEIVNELVPLLKLRYANL